MGAVDLKSHYIAISYAMIGKACEAQAIDATDVLARMQHKGATLAVFVRPAPEAFVKLLPPGTGSIDGKEESGEFTPVFAVNGQFYAPPEEWPPKGHKRVESWKGEEWYLLCESDIDRKEEDEIIETATTTLSMTEAVLAVFGEAPDEYAQLPYDAQDTMISAMDKEEPGIYRSITEDTYLKWWSTYASEDEDGERCVEIPLLTEVFVLERK